MSWGNNTLPENKINSNNSLSTLLVICEMEGIWSTEYCQCGYFHTAGFLAWKNDWMEGCSRIGNLVKLVLVANSLNIDVMDLIAAGIENNIAR